MGWGIAFLIVLLLVILPLGVSVVYNDAGPLIRVIAGPVKLKVYPQKKIDPDKPPKAKKNKDKKKDSEEKKEKSGTDKTDKEQTAGGSIADFLPFAELVLNLLDDFRQAIRVDRINFKLTLAGGDPADLAIQYGKAWAIAGDIWALLESWFVIRKRNVEILCDFEGSSTTVIARLDFTITFGRLLLLIVRYAFKALVEYLNFRKKRNGGTTV